MNASKSVCRKAAASLSRSSLGNSRVVPRNARVAQPRTYTTSVIRNSTVAEDYDVYSLYGTPQEPTHCDLGAIVKDSPFVIEGDVGYYGEEPVWNLQTNEPFWRSWVEGEPEEESRNDARADELERVGLRPEMAANRTMDHE